MPRDEKDGGSGPGALVWAGSDGFLGVAMVLVEVKRELLRGLVAWDWGGKALGFADLKQLGNPKGMLFFIIRAEPSDIVSGVLY